MGEERENIYLQEVKDITNDTLERITTLHKIMHGTKNDVLEKLHTSFLKYLKDFYGELINSCEEKMEELKLDILNNSKELSTLEEELNMKSNFSVDESDPLVVVIEKIKNIIKNYESIKSERISKLNTFLEKETKLCNILGVSPFPTISGVPTEEQISSLEQQVIKLQEEEYNRRNTYKAIKNSIDTMMKELEYASEHSFYDEVMNATEENLNLKRAFIERMKNFEDHLKEEHQIANNNVDYLKEKLNKLWERINIDENYKVTFMKNITGIGKSFQNMLKIEIERSEEIKRANIKPVTESVRNEIREMWQKLTYNEEQKKLFISFFSDAYSDELLTLHEIELNKLKILYQENKHIYDLAEKRESLWKRMQHLDEAALDKNRFKNRGGQLLKEEKERKILESSVPKTDSQLRIYLDQYLEKTGNFFLWHGEDLLQKIVSDWEGRQHGKDSKKMAMPRKALKRTPNQRRNHFSPTHKDVPNPPAELSIESISSYSGFEDQMECDMNSAPKSKKRTVLKEINNSPARAHSSPTSTPMKCKTPRTPRRCLLTPKRWR